MRNLVREPSSKTLADGGGVRPAAAIVVLTNLGNDGSLRCRDHQIGARLSVIHLGLMMVTSLQRLIAAHTVIFDSRHILASAAGVLDSAVIPVLRLSSRRPLLIDNLHRFFNPPVILRDMNYVALAQCSVARTPQP